MLKKSQIKEIAIKLGWGFKETEIAVKELRDSTSIKDCDEFLKICLAAVEPQERWKKVREFLLVNLVGDDLAKTICDLLRIDPCFYALALFNIRDLQGTVRLRGNLRTTFSGEKSFIHWGVSDIDFLENPTTKSLSSLKGREQVLSASDVMKYIDLFEGYGVPIWKQLEKAIYKPDELTYEFLNALLDYKVMASAYLEEEILDLKKLLIHVVERAGFLAFNIRRFRSLVSSLYYNPNTPQEDKGLLSELAALLYNPIFNRDIITQRGHWLIYFLVETLRQKGYGTNESFRKVAKHLHNKPSSIERRYFEKKMEAKEKEFTLDKIINQFWLHKAAEENLLGLLEKG
jgi:hypothetical protein